MQTWLVQKAASSLSEKLHTKVSIESVDFAFFYKLQFEKLLIEDQAEDTLLYAGAAKVNINDWFFAKDKIILKYIGLDDAQVNLTRTKEVWNYQFILDYFEDSTSTKTKNKKEIAFELNEAELNNIKFNKIDKWIGDDMIASLTHLDVLFDKADLTTQNFLIKNINLTEPIFAEKDYTGNRPLNYVSTPPSEKNSNLNSEKNKNHWLIAIKKMHIKHGPYQNDI